MLSPMAEQAWRVKGYKLECGHHATHVERVDDRPAVNAIAVEVGESK